MPLELPRSRAQIAAIQSERKRVALAQARRAPFYRGKLDHVNADRLDDPEEWRHIPILDKESLRALSDREFYESFCVSAPDGIAEYWRSGGATGKPLFYPRSPTDIRYGVLSLRARHSTASAAAPASACTTRSRSASIRSGTRSRAPRSCAASR
jgi:phenylacetate-CoA ligase